MTRFIPPIFIFLIVATTLEASGDAMVRIGLRHDSIPLKITAFIAGAVLLFGYGLFVNLPPVEFGRVVGLYIATLFIVWQIVNFVAFGGLPAMPVLAGGALIVVGGVIVTFWSK